MTSGIAKEWKVSSRAMKSQREITQKTREKGKKIRSMIPEKERRGK
jgi:hypothetical protein